jgi:ABC-2 type transport system ATP-binding protein
MEYLVEAEHLTKCYGSLKAVDDLTFKIQAGDIVGLVGKNGAGKSTLIRLLTGLANPTSGSFSLFGDKNPKNLHTHLKDVTAMIETPALIERMSGKDNLYYACLMKGIKDPLKNNYIANKMAFVGLGSMYQSSKPVSKYSLGMRQRLSIAVSLIGDPKLMILDEPTNGLDPNGIKEIRDLLTKINQENHVTMIISSHILSELSKFATTYLFLDRGRIVGDIRADEMEKDTGKALHLIASDNAKAMAVLQEKKMDATLEKDEILIRGEKNPTDVLNLIYASGLTLSYFKEDENSLEDYYLKLTEDR